jgi:hypothetical protein
MEKILRVSLILIRADGIQTRSLLIVLFWLGFVTGCAIVQQPKDMPAGRFQFGVIGDQGYDAESEAKFPHLMADLNQSNLTFVVHVGDIGVPPYGSCRDETYYRRKDEFQLSSHPFIFTPGDNDWVDCYDPKVGGYNPVERLAKLRELFFQGEQSLGQRTIPLTRQSSDAKHAKFRENARWTYGNISFVTLHIVGSNNNLGRTPEMDAEFAERSAANLAWMNQAFEIAKRDGNNAIVLFMQANPRFEDNLPARRTNNLRVAPPGKELGGYKGYKEFLSALEKEVLAFDKPVVVVHGDTHYFRVDKPLFDPNSKEAAGRRGRVIENFTRLEVFGFPESHWVRVTVDPNDPNLFTFNQELVKKNLVNHSTK